MFRLGHHKTMFSHVSFLFLFSGAPAAQNKQKHPGAGDGNVGTFALAAPSLGRAFIPSALRLSFRTLAHPSSFPLSTFRGTTFDPSLLTISGNGTLLIACVAYDVRVVGSPCQCGTSNTIRHGVDSDSRLTIACTCGLDGLFPSINLILLRRRGGHCEARSCGILLIHVADVHV